MSGYNWHYFRGAGHWRRAARQMLSYAFDLQRFAENRLTLDAVEQIIASAPTDRELMQDPQWAEDSYCIRCLDAAERRTEHTSDRRAYERTRDFWLGQFPTMNERTRGDVIATITALIDGLLRDPIHRLFCTDSTLVPELTHEGMIVILDLPVKDFQEVGRFAQVLFKTAWQRATENRDRANRRPVFLWADEAQLFATRHDMVFQQTARSSRACTVYLTQNIANYQAVLDGGKEGAVTDSLLGNLQTKIFHANGDPRTNKWAEGLIGNSWAYRPSFGSGQSQGHDDESPSESGNINVSESLDPQFIASDFTKLRKGGPACGWCVDGVVFQGGRTWNATGRNFLPVTFQQRF